MGVEKGFMSMPQSKSEEEGEENNGRKICAWCKKDLGSFEGDGISHGMCQKCADNWSKGKTSPDSSEKEES
jgi:hypothetical protein